MAVMEEARFVRLNHNKNGFSNQRTHRVIGEMPVEDFAALEYAAEACGDYLTGEDLRKYLHRNPQYRTVEAIDTGASGKIVVK